MMKLILSLTVIWTLSSTAEALQCWQKEGGETPVLGPCEPNRLCATVTTAELDVQKGTVDNFIRKSCEQTLRSEGNHTYSMNDGNRASFVSIHLCNTDGCNKEDIPYPDVQEKNNFTCFGCNDDKTPHSNCNQTVQCYGEMDRCYGVTVEYGRRFSVFGCVTANHCETISNLELIVGGPGGKFVHPPKCCEGSLCNSV